MAEIQLQSISKRFGDTEVIANLDLTLPDGQFTVLLGPSGCGKSTLLRMIAGLETPSGGDVRIAGQVVNELPPGERGCALVFQNYALYPNKTVRHNLMFPLRMARLPAAEQAQRVDEIAGLLELTPLLDRYPRQLSGGQRQRVAMGRAMIRRPHVFLYDEPLSNLDLELRVRLRLEIARLQRRLKSTAVYVTHDQTEAMTLADQIVVLRRGRIEQVGPPLALYRKPANLFVAGFIGTPRINLFGISGCVPAEGGSRFQIGPAATSSPSPPSLASQTSLQWLQVPRILPASICTIGFRPEQARLGQAGPGQIAIELRDCETQAVEHLGDRAFCYLRCSLGEVVVLAPDADARLSGTLQLAIDAQELHFFGADEARIG